MKVYCIKCERKFFDMYKITKNKVFKKMKKSETKKPKKLHYSITNISTHERKHEIHGQNKSKMQKRQK